MVVGCVSQCLDLPVEQPPFTAEVKKNRVSKAMRASGVLGGDTCPEKVWETLALNLKQTWPWKQAIVSGFSAMFLTQKRCLLLITWQSEAGLIGLLLLARFR
ncbi:MAG: hypothetical protein IT343_02120 [Candidatus Melainabacteria bacterium]|nr:hypothetical protein [Candidatus Melainabacteria bacterium]